MKHNFGEEHHLHKHGGDIYTHPGAVDFSANINDRGMPEAVARAAREAVDRCGDYPDPCCRALREAIGQREGVPKERIICGNGAADLIFALVLAVKPRRALVPAPAFYEYEQALAAVGCNPEKYYLKEEKGFQLGEDFLDRIKMDTDLVFLCNPNNPTGVLTDPEFLKRVLLRCIACRAILVLDECFNDFLEQPERYTLKRELNSTEYLFILKAFTKMYAMAGLRLGYGMSGNEKLLSKMEQVTQPWSVSVPAQAAGCAAAKEIEFAHESAVQIQEEKKRLKQELIKLGYEVCGSAANYIFFKGPDGLYEDCLKQGVLIRDCENYEGLTKGWYRIAVKSPKDNQRLVHVLRGISNRAKEREGVMAKAIMIQGTMSNAGKSLIAAGLCRIFKQDGYRVCPFKSQNMALNSFITRDGLEMGRAQVMQAEAAGVEPSVLMNPILLKPTNDTGSQVIVNGEVLGNMSAREYFAYKKELIPQVEKAYETLAREYDIMVIEGAGSPAEINLKQEDIVNMGMAKLAKAPVLLVGDIDRGGVFAQLIGTIQLLDEDERQMVRGLVINKFRGDKSILDPGVAKLEELSGIAVVGVAPYLHIDVEDEDSLSERFTQNREVSLIDIAVIRLPRISNFTDFNVLERFDGVSLRYVDAVSQLKQPDLIILPGTKNTMQDLAWLRQVGLEAAILKAKDRGCVIFGVCGGYQMLGDSISDPQGVEQGGQLRGMGLLPMDTVFAGEKTRTRVTGRFLELKGALSGLSGMELEGYEIHMGRSIPKKGLKPMTAIRDWVQQESYQEPPSVAFKQPEEKTDGAQQENVYGSYVHGIFDQEQVARGVILALAKRKGIPMEHIASMDYQSYKETQYDKLAEGLRSHLDMKKIYEILEEGL